LVLPGGILYIKLIIKKAKEKAEAEENRKCIKYRNTGSFKKTFLRIACTLKCDRVEGRRD
jgi:hypothetical protein